MNLQEQLLEKREDAITDVQTTAKEEIRFDWLLGLSSARIPSLNLQTILNSERKQDAHHSARFLFARRKWSALIG